MEKDWGGSPSHTALACQLHMTWGRIAITIKKFYTNTTPYIQSIILPSGGYSTVTFWSKKKKFSPCDPFEE